MVWETRKVRKEVSHSRFASLYLPSLLTTDIEKTLGHAASSTSLACKSEPEVGLCRISTPFTCPPPSHVKASRRWVYVVF